MHCPFFGNFLADPTAVPRVVIAHLAKQLDIAEPSCLLHYRERPVTRHEHAAEIQRRRRSRLGGWTPVRGPRAHPPCRLQQQVFHVERGVTYYNFTSNQFSGFHGIVIPGTLHDSPYVLDGLLEHQLARHRVKTVMIAQHWDDFLRVAGSLKMGTVRASELIRSLQRGGRVSTLGRAIGELGRIPKTLHLLRGHSDRLDRRVAKTLPRERDNYCLAGIQSWCDSSTSKERSRAPTECHAHSCITMAGKRP
jgi:hypothetical protein